MILKKIYKRCVIHKWEIGFVETPLSDVIGNADIKVRWIRHNYKDRWFADPFILDANDNEISLLVEEYLDFTGLGRISRLIIDRKTYCLKELIPVLELPTHLSFPAILRYKGEVYIYPENSQSGNLKLYRYNTESNECLLIDNIMPKPLTDAVIAEIYDENYILSTSLPDPNGDTLKVYCLNADTRSSDYNVKFEENIARNGGAVFKHDGSYYRPAQEEKSGMYGIAISIQKIGLDCDNHLTFEEVRRITSPDKSLDLGFHTFNVYKDLIVVDAKGFRHPRLGRFCYFLKHLFGYK